MYMTEGYDGHCASVNIVYTIKVVNPDQEKPMGREKVIQESINLTLTASVSKARIDAVLAEGETRLDLVRGAIDREVSARERKAKRGAQ